MNDETLTLYYYDELSVAERREVAAALESDAALAERYRVLREELDGLMTSEAPAAPTHLVAQWHDVIDKAATNELVAVAPPSRSFHFGSFFWGAAIAASLAIGIAIGVFVSGDDPTTTPMVAHTSPAPVDASGAFSRGLLVHFRDSRQQLAGINPGMNGERQLLIQSIIDQNRLFERIADQNDSADLARVLRAFEPILVRLAAEDVSPEEAARLQAQLSFELGVVLTKLGRRVSESTDDIET
jgi:hypothetical protein